MASRPKTRARLQGALASRKDKRTSYPLPATHQEAPRNDFWGLFLAFMYKRASSSVNALRTALRPSRSPLVLQLRTRLPCLLGHLNERTKLLADALHLALDDFVGVPGCCGRAYSGRACARPMEPCTSLCVPCRNRLASDFSRLKSSTLDLSYAKDVAGDTPAPLRDRGGTVSGSSRRRSHEGASPLKLPLVAAVCHTSHVTYIFGRSSRIYTCPDLMGFLRRPRLTSVTQLRASAQSAEWRGLHPSKPPRALDITEHGTRNTGGCVVVHPPVFLPTCPITP